MKKYHKEIYELYKKHKINVFVAKIKRKTDVKKEVEKFWKFPEKVDFKEKIYFYLFEENPYCSHGHKRTFLNFKKGYYSKYVKTCSECKKIIKSNQEKTNLKKYGSENPFSSNFIKQKIKETLKRRYGIENPSQSKSFLNKKRKTWIEKYNVDNPLKNEDIRNRIKITNMQKYGFENPSSSNIVNKKRKNTFMVKYGVDNPMRKHIYNIEDWIENFELIYNKFNGNERELSKYFNVDITTIQKRVLRCNLREKYFSSYEIEIGKFLSENKLIFESRNHNILKNYEIDIYIPEHNIGIEFHGLFWHSSSYQQDIFYHYKKYIQAKENKIILIQIFEDEWNFDKEKIKEIILNFVKKDFSFLNLNSEKLVIDNRFHPGDDFLTKNNYAKVKMLKPKKWYTDYIVRKRRKFKEYKDIIYDAGYELWIRK